MGNIYQIKERVGELVQKCFDFQINMANKDRLLINKFKNEIHKLGVTEVLDEIIVNTNLGQIVKQKVKNKETQIIGGGGGIQTIENI